jgi:ATP-binding cassette subfamily F protein 3
LFSGDDVEKKIRVLSGGEKARVALAKTIVSKANFLLLDEPTNHLDIHSVDLLIESLNKYNGTYLLVSHDRYFVNKTANKIWEIEDHKIKEFVGTYDEWEEMKRKRESLQTNKVDVKQGDQSKKNVVQKPKQQSNKNSNVDDKNLKREHQQVQKQFQQVEEKIALLNKEKVRLENSLSDKDIYSDKKKFSDVEKSLQNVSIQLKELDIKYEALFDSLMDLEKVLGASN